MYRSKNLSLSGINQTAYNKNNSNKRRLPHGCYNIFITRNGKVAKVVNPQVSAVDTLRGMLGGISSGIDMDSLREERLLKYENNV